MHKMIKIGVNAPFLISALFISSTLALTSCSNSKLSKSLASGSSTKTSDASNVVIQYDSFTISSVYINAPATAGAKAYQATVNFTTATTGTSMTNDCSIATGPNPCQCKYSWNEINNSGSTTVTIPRLVYTDVTIVGTAQISCAAPDAWASEIPDGTAVIIAVVPAANNPFQFRVPNFSYQKGQNLDTGNFKDNMGRSYVNILRYSCYEQRLRGMSIINFTSAVSNTTLGSKSYLTANRFCVRKADTTVKPTVAGCETIDAADYTAQAYYFNLFIRDSESGDINPGNNRFLCPLVKEALNYDGTNPGTQNKYWPLDTSFALSLGKNSDFSVGVVANSKTSNVNDPTALNTACDGTTSTPGAADSMISSCLGFAAKPNVDGTCPSIALANGGTMKTYRLRRFIALYPPAYDTDGSALPEPQSVDMVYVVDRPVVSGTDEYTMLGPKPCPFAFFDRKKDTGGTPTYLATSNSAWTGRNVDGLTLPNQDSATSCASMIPLTNATLSKVSLGTVHSSNVTASMRNIAIRPITAWASHYEEDTAFQACSPLSHDSSNNVMVRNPPLHFTKHNNGTPGDPSDDNVNWCAEVFPTQNNNVTRIDTSSPLGTVSPYTSHVAKNSTSADCAATAAPTILTPTGYPAGAAGYANHNPSTAWDTKNAALTCDRTVVNPANGVSWPRFPLLAPAADVESAMQQDSSYGCLITYDANKGKAGKRSPTQGCCGSSTNVWSGSPAAPRNRTSAHLEPGAFSSLPASSCGDTAY